MKKLILLLLLFPLISKAQNEWLLGGNLINSGSATSAVAPGTLGTYAGAPYTGSDRNLGEIAFFVRDDQVFDYYGTYKFNLPIFRTVDYCTDYSKESGISGEVAIVPVPQSTTPTYYVIYEQDFNGYGTPGIFWVKVSLDNSGEPYISGGLNPFSCTDNGAGAYSGTNPTELDEFYTYTRSTMSFTVSKAINSNGDCYLYTCGGPSYGGLYGIKRYSITSGGIGGSTTIQTSNPSISGFNLTDCDFLTHDLKLSPDQHFLTWCSDKSTSSCAATSKPVWVLPLIDYNSYSSLGLTSQIYNVANTTAIGGVSFSPDSHNLYYTNSSGLNYAAVNYVTPFTLGTTATVASTTSFSHSDLAIGQNNQMYAIDGSSSDLDYFDVLSGNTLSTTTDVIKSNSSNNYNSTYRLPKDFNFASFDYQFVANVDINTRCIPANLPSGIHPQFNVTVGGGYTALTYNWYPLQGNTTTLDDYHSATPTITSSTSPYIAYYYLTVTDQNGFDHRVTTRIVKVNMITGGYDLASRDSYVDMYDEPNSQQAVTGLWDVWTTPDIYNRHFNTGLTNTTHQDPQHDPSADSNYLYTIVRNVGCATSPATIPGTGAAPTVNLYWTVGGTSEQWPIAWTSGTLTGPYGPVHQGGQLASISIDQIAPGDAKTYYTGWVPPDPANYFAGASSMEMCFLSRIVDNHNYPAASDGMTTMEGLGLSDNVRKNNNIVTRNTTVWDVNVLSPKMHHVIVGNVSEESSTYSLQFVNESSFHPGTTSTLSQYVYIKVFLGKDLFTNWQRNGGLGHYAAVDTKEMSVTFDGTNTMQLDGVVMAGSTEYPVTLGVYNIDGADVSEMQTETIHFRQISGTGSDATIYGNCNYTLQYNPNDGNTDQLDKATHPINSSVTAIANGTDRIRVYPNPASSMVYFEYPVAGKALIKITDVTGRLMSEKEMSNSAIAAFDVNGYAPGVYVYQIVLNGRVTNGKIVINNK